MAKGIIVVDVPENCLECKACYHAEDLELCGLVKRLYRCRFEPGDIDEIYLPDIMRAKPDWCPIRPLPERKDYKWPDAVNGTLMSIRAKQAIDEAGKMGWNACIDEILKEE